MLLLTLIFLQGKVVIVDDIGLSQTQLDKLGQILKNRHNTQSTSTGYNEHVGNSNNDREEVIKGAKVSNNDNEEFMRNERKGINDTKQMQDRKNEKSGSVNDNKYGENGIEKLKSGANRYPDRYKQEYSPGNKKLPKSETYKNQPSDQNNNKENDQQKNKNNRSDNNDEEDNNRAKKPRENNYGGGNENKQQNSDEGNGNRYGNRSRGNNNGSIDDNNQDNKPHGNSNGNMHEYNQQNSNEEDNSYPIRSYKGTDEYNQLNNNAYGNKQGNRTHGDNGYGNDYRYPQNDNYKNRYPYKYNSPDKYQSSQNDNPFQSNNNDYSQPHNRFQNDLEPQTDQNRESNHPYPTDNTPPLRNDSGYKTPTTPRTSYYPNDDSSKTNTQPHINSFINSMLETEEDNTQDPFYNKSALNNIHEKIYTPNNDLHNNILLHSPLSDDPLKSHTKSTDSVDIIAHDSITFPEDNLLLQEKGNLLDAAMAHKSLLEIKLLKSHTKAQNFNENIEKIKDKLQQLENNRTHSSEQYSTTKSNLSYLKIKKTTITDNKKKLILERDKSEASIRLMQTEMAHLRKKLDELNLSILTVTSAKNVYATRIKDLEREIEENQDMVDKENNKLVLRKKDLNTLDVMRCEAKIMVQELTNRKNKEMNEQERIEMEKKRIEENYN